MNSLESSVLYHQVQNQRCVALYSVPVMQQSVLLPLLTAAAAAVGTKLAGAAAAGAALH